MNMLFSLDLNVHANPKVTGCESHKKRRLRMFEVIPKDSRAGSDPP